MHRQLPQVRRLGAVKLGERLKVVFILLCSKSDNAKVSTTNSVKDHPVEINRVKIKFIMVRTSFTVNRHLKVGETSPWVDLKGETLY